MQAVHKTIGDMVTTEEAVVKAHGDALGGGASADLESLWGKFAAESDIYPSKTLLIKIGQVRFCSKWRRSTGCRVETASPMVFYLVTDSEWNRG